MFITVASILRLYFILPVCGGIKSANILVPSVLVQVKNVTISYHTMPCHTIPYHTIQYNAIRYNTIQYPFFIPPVGEIAFSAPCTHKTTYILHIKEIYIQLQNRDTTYKVAKVRMSI